MVESNDNAATAQQTSSTIDDNSSPLKLDYTIEDPRERTKIVQQIINNTPKEKLSNKYLEILSDYIIFAMDKEQKKQKKLLTENRMVTINKRETSFEGLVGKLENGEDGIYNMVSDNKNQLLTPKISITQKDLDEIPELRQIKIIIDQLEKEEKAANGNRGRHHPGGDYFLLCNLSKHEFRCEKYSGGGKGDGRERLRCCGEGILPCN